ncbi:MAG TPA: YceI family protein [Bryobacteraceae bacterium]|nr:YceI family protein [Bryobacteraceae bacterium]
MTATYQIDPAHSTAHFVVRHMMITNVRGAFSNMQGTVVYDPADLASSKIDVSIDAGTVHTRVDERDAHLKSADFFDVKNFPRITFHSKKIERSNDDELKVAGDLSLHGVTREVILKVEGPTQEEKDPWGNLRIGASASAKIKRSDFGLTWNAALETGGVLVGDDVKIELEVSLIKSQAAAA